MKQTILHAIFFDLHDNWQKFYDKNRRKIRGIVKKEVLKFKECGDLRKGFKLFVCEGCHKVKLIPFRCKGKFCPTCSVGESQKWSEVLAEDMFHVVHRHMVFTIDEGLRTIFLRYHRKELLKGLMDEAAKIMTDYFKKKHIQPGIIVALHTFGSQLEFNPHIHMVITMGGVTPDGRWDDYDYVPYPMLRIRWQNAVLKLIRRTLNETEKRKVQPLLQRAYKQNSFGFYVNAPKRSRTKLRGLLQYISRYMRRGPIALERIVMYDGHAVMFRYQDKKTNQEETKVMEVQAFIGALIRHIPDKQFKTIRRYGTYSRRLKSLMKRVVEAFQLRQKRLNKVQRVVKQKSWAERIHESFGHNPLQCSCCGNYYVYMGMSVLKNGHLTIQYAKNSHARTYMKEEIERLEKESFEIKQKEIKAKIYEGLRFNWGESD